LRLKKLESKYNKKDSNTPTQKPKHIEQESSLSKYLDLDLKYSLGA